MFVLDPVHTFQSVWTYCPAPNMLFTSLCYPNDLLTKLPAVLHACFSVCIMSQMCGCAIWSATRPPLGFSCTCLMYQQNNKACAHYLIEVCTLVPTVEPIASSNDNGSKKKARHQCVHNPIQSVLTHIHNGLWHCFGNLKKEITSLT